LKQGQKDVYQGRKPALKKRSTGGTKSRTALENTEGIAKDSSSSAVDSATGGKTARGSQNPKLRQTNKLNKAVTSQSGTDSTNDIFAQSFDTKRSQSPRLCRTSKALKCGKQGSRTSEETNLSDDSNINVLCTKAQSPKLRRFVPQNKLGTGSPDVRNGTKGRNTPYITRSDSPARVLRNGKRRRLKDPSLLEGLDVGLPKRRRLLSTTKDGSGGELSSKSELCLDDQSSVAGSDSSVCDFPRLENGKASCDSDCDSKIQLDETKNEEHPAHSVHSSPCSEDQSHSYHDRCLGKSISNRITELIHRNKCLESAVKELIPKAEEQLVSAKPSESSETDHGKFIENEKNLTDTNFNLCGPESIASEKSNCNSAEHQSSHDCSTHNTSSRNEVSETKEKEKNVLPAAKKVTAHENADLKELGHKNGQNLSIDIALYHLREKSARKIRDVKITKNKKFFQECPSSSGVFYVVQNPSDVPLQKEGAMPVTPLCSGENQESVTCGDAHSASRDILVLNSSVKEKQSAQCENFALTEGGASSVSMRDVVKDGLQVCDSLQMEQESIPVLSQTVICEGDVLCTEDDSVTAVANRKECVSDFIIDRRRCSNVDNKEDAHNINSDFKDDGSTINHDRKVDCESAVSDIKINYNELNKPANVDCVNAVIQGAEVTNNSNVRLETSNNNDSVGRHSVFVDHMNIVNKEESLMDAGLEKECKETASDVDIKFDHNETGNDSNSVTDCKEIPHDCSSSSNNSQKPVFFDIPETADHNVKAVLEPMTHADCEIDAHEVGKNIRRSTRSSVGKVRAAMLHCMTAGRMKQTKLYPQEKSQDVVKVDAESLSVCSTDDGSTVDSEDVPFAAGKTSEVKDKQNDLQEKHAEVKVVKMEAQVALETKNNEMAGMLEEPVVHPENIDEEERISDQDKREIIPELKMNISDVIDFTNVGGEKIVSNKDLIDSEPTVQDESKSTHKVELCSKLKEGTDDKLSAQNKFDPQIVTHMKEGEVDCISEVNVDNAKDVIINADEVLVHKLQSPIEPALFYSKENLRDSRSHDSKHESSDITGNMIKSDIYENQCDSKHQHASSSTEEEFPSSTTECSTVVGQAHDNSKSHIEEVFQKKVTEEQCDKMSEDCAIGIIFDVNSIQHDVEQLEGGESLHKVSSFISSSAVGSSEILDVGGCDSKVGDSKKMIMGEEVSPEEQATKESVLSALGLQPLRAIQVLCNIPTLTTYTQRGDKLTYYVHS
jgi:hypothetical protein